MMIQSKEPHLSISTENFMSEEGLLLISASVQTAEGVGEVRE